MSKTFSVGDRVTWTSQAGGHSKKKTGTVIEVVPAFKIPRDKNFGSNRKHESYIVEVTYAPKRSTSAIKSVRTKKPERYWPVVRNLHLVARGSTSATKAAPSVAMHDYDPKPAPDVLMEDLKTDHLPVQVIETPPDMLWKDVQDAERAIANANSESTN